MYLYMYRLAECSSLGLKSLNNKTQPSVVDELVEDGLDRWIFHVIFQPNF